MISEEEAAKVDAEFTQMKEEFKAFTEKWKDNYAMLLFVEHDITESRMLYGNACPACVTGTLSLMTLLGEIRHLSSENGSETPNMDVAEFRRVLMSKIQEMKLAAMEVDDKKKH